MTKWKTHQYPLVLIWKYFKKHKGFYCYKATRDLKINTFKLKYHMKTLSMMGLITVSKKGVRDYAELKQSK